MACLDQQFTRLRTVLIFTQLKIGQKAVMTRFGLCCHGLFNIAACNAPKICFKGSFGQDDLAFNMTGVVGNQLFN